MPFKITTWNVNGLRAVLNKGALAPVLDTQPDVLMLQEIKARPDQILPALQPIWPGAAEQWHPAERPGYSGVATFLQSSPQEVSTGLGLPNFDCEGRAILARFPEFSLVNAYFPSGQRDAGRVNYKLEFYAALLEICDRLHAAGEQVIIGGDFNTAHREIDLFYPKQNQKTSGFLPEERAWVDRYLAHGFVDAFRALYPDRVHYTWWSSILNARSRGIGWRLDYFLVSESLLPRVADVVIHDQLYGSDHCPVSLILN